MVASLVKRMVLIAGAWELSGGSCNESEKQFELLLEELKKTASIGHEEAVQLVLKEVS